MVAAHRSGGAEVQFGKNAVIDIGFNQRTPPGTTKLKNGATANPLDP